MCYGFSGLLSEDGKVYFIEPDDKGNISHCDIARRLFRKDEVPSHYIAFEFTQWTPQSFHWEAGSANLWEVPTWADKEICMKTFEKVLPIYLKYRDTVYTYPPTKTQKSDWEKDKKAALREFKKIPGYVPIPKLKFKKGQSVYIIGKDLVASYRYLNTKGIIRKTDKSDYTIPYLVEHYNNVLLWYSESSLKEVENEKLSKLDS